MRIHLHRGTLSISLRSCVRVKSPESQTRLRYSQTRWTPLTPHLVTPTVDTKYVPNPVTIRTCKLPSQIAQLPLGVTLTMSTHFLSIAARVAVAIPAFAVNVSVPAFNDHGELYVPPVQKFVGGSRSIYGCQDGFSPTVLPSPVRPPRKFDSGFSSGRDRGFLGGTCPSDLRRCWWERAGEAPSATGRSL